MVGREVPLTVPEGDAPRYTFQLPGPHDLTSAILELRVKPTRDTPDTEALGVFPGTVAPPAAAGRFTVQLDSSVTAAPGSYFYKVTMVAGGKRQTLQHGDWHVVNT
jgi:hypothetical protein